jgi:hypothetical protein
LVLDPLERGRVPDDYRVRIGRLDFMESKSPTAIPIHYIECGEDESVGEEETELLEQILVRRSLLAPEPHFII